MITRPPKGMSMEMGVSFGYGMDIDSEIMELKQKVRANEEKIAEILTRKKFEWQIPSETEL